MNKEQYKTYLRQRLSEDTQTPLRKAEGEKAIKKLEDTYKTRIEIAARIPNPHIRSTAADNALERANVALTKLSNRVALQKKEQESKTRYGLGGKRRKTQ